MKALVLGGAACLWEDLEAVGAWNGTIIATNDAGWAYPHRIDHWASLHPDKFALWEPKRDGPGRYTRWTHYEHEYAHRVVDHWKGSAAGLGIRVAYALRCHGVLLVGCPLTETPHFLGGEPWSDAHTFRQEWTDTLLPRLEQVGYREHVYSMSGWTRDVLGGPPEGWLNEPDARC